MQVRGSVEDGFYVENLYQTYIETIDELLTILEEGLKHSEEKNFSCQIDCVHSGELNRAMASHKLNDTSSRSHALLSIQIEQDVQESDDPNEQMTRQGKLIFVDLAGNKAIVSIRIYLSNHHHFLQVAKKSNLVTLKASNSLKRITSIKVY